ADRRLGLLDKLVEASVGTRLLARPNGPPQASTREYCGTGATCKLPPRQAARFATDLTIVADRLRGCASQPVTGPGYRLDFKRPAGERDPSANGRDRTVAAVVAYEHA